jgi:hypothetical protein
MSEKQFFREADDRQLNHAEIEGSATFGMSVTEALMQIRYWPILICAATYVFFQFGITAEWSAVIAIFMVGAHLLILKSAMVIAVMHELTSGPDILNERDDPDINKLTSCPCCRRLVSARCRVCPKCNHRFSP